MDTETIHKEVMQALGLDQLPKDEREQLLIAMGEVVHRGVMRKVWGALSPSQQGELDARIEASIAEPENDAKRLAVQAYLREHVTDFEKYVSEEIDALKKAQEAAYGEMTS